MKTEHFEGAGIETLEIPNFIKASIEKSDRGTPNEEDKKDIPADKKDDKPNPDDKKDIKVETKENPTDNLLNNLFGSKKEGEEVDDDDKKEEFNADGTKKEVIDEDTSAIEDLAKGYGLDADEFKEYFKDFDFKDESVENLRKFNEIRDEFVADQAITEVVEKFPDVGSLLNHLASGKSLDTWNQKIQIKDYSKVTVDKENVEQQKGLIRELLVKQGVKSKMIEATITSLKDEELLAEAEDSLKTLDKIEKDKLKNIEVSESARIEADKKVAQAAFTEVTGLIKGGKINGVVIPDTEKKEFAQFALSDDTRMKEFDKLSTEQQLFIDYMVFKKFKLKGIEIKQDAAEQKKTIKKITGDRKPVEASGADDGKETISLADLKKKMNPNAVSQLAF